MSHKYYPVYRYLKYLGSYTRKFNGMSINNIIILHLYQIMNLMIPTSIFTYNINLESYTSSIIFRVLLNEYINVEPPLYK